MNANVSFRHMDSSSSLRSYATEKLERICDKYVQGKVDASVVMSVEKFWHIANFTIQIKNLTVKGEERSEDMYSSIDLALDKIEKQLRRHKDRLRDYKPSNGDSRLFKMGVLSPLAPTGQLAEESEFEEEFAEDYELYPEPSSDSEQSLGAEATSSEVKEVVTTASGSKLSVMKNNTYQAKALTVEEAVLQLDLLSDRQFYVFTNVETGAINVVYHRNDAQIGLIET